jgi:CRP-like cAMP-binding protein
VQNIKPAQCANRLLAGMPEKQRQHFLSGCKSVKLVFGEILSEPGELIRHVYFPTDSSIALTKPMTDQSSLEVGLIGDEGMIGIPLALDVNLSPLHAVVQGCGSVLRMNATRFRRELAQSRVLQQILNRYLYVVMSQLAQTAACTRFHVVERRLSRWLLMTQDRAHSSSFHVTHEFLSHMLGVRRVGITKAASALQTRKLISYSRGNIKVHNRAGLEAASCECYAADNRIYASIMSGEHHLIKAAK